MSHSLGAVQYKDKSIKYYEYNGTSDTIISCCYDTVEEVNNNWRDHKEKECSCGGEENFILVVSPVKIVVVLNLIILILT